MWYWHVHREQLLEKSNNINIQERIEYIREHKTEKEIPIRLAWLQPILNQSYADQALSEYKKIECPAWSEFKKIWDQAWSEYKKIEGSALSEYKTKMETLHNQEHPGCPWDGKTLLSKEAGF